MKSVVAMLVIGFLATLAWFLVGKRGQKEVWWIAGGLALIVGLGINVAENAPRAEKVTKTYQQCLPDIGRGTMNCTTTPYSTNEVVNPEGEPFIKKVGYTLLETPAAFTGILAGLGLARLVGGEGGSATPRTRGSVRIERQPHTRIHKPTASPIQDLAAWALARRLRDLALHSAHALVLRDSLQ